MEKFEQLFITELVCDQALHRATALSQEGLIVQEQDYCYLKIDDNYVHDIHPLLGLFGNVEKPNYFTPPHNVGAHISIIYPEERIRLSSENVGQRHAFSISGLIKAQYGMKAYFALAVTSPSLALFRQKHYLQPKPTFKGQQIVFHITIGVRHYW